MPLRFTSYFESMRARPDRAKIEFGWIELTVVDPQFHQVQSDGRIRRWRSIPEAGGRYLRVVLLPDGVTVHNAFFDRGFVP